MASSVPYSLCGLIVSGDIAGFTIYTSKRLRKVWFPAASPPNPPSTLQTWTREKFRSAMHLYAALTAAEKKALSACSKRLAIVGTGPSLWVSLCFQPNDSFRKTLERQSGLTLPDPTTAAWPSRKA